VSSEVKRATLTRGGYRNLEFRLTRSANDLPASPVTYHGKGASSCTTGRLITWAMTPSPQP